MTNEQKRHAFVASVLFGGGWLAMALFSYLTKQWEPIAAITFVYVIPVFAILLVHALHRLAKKWWP